MTSKVALIFGASGVTGWAFVNEILNDYPKKGVWSGVHALTNRPLSAEKAFWPTDDRLTITSRIDLLEGTQENLESKLGGIPGIAKVTHVFYLAYKANTDNPQEVRENVDMFKRAIIASDNLCPNMEFVVNQTGAKTYGCHLLRNRPNYLVPPFHEDGVKLGEPESATLFYYPMLDWLTEYSKNKAWSWAETRPDIIIGFVPNQNWYSLGMALGFFFSLYREINGEGAECPFPGTGDSWLAKSQDSSSDMIARQTLHIALSPDTPKGHAYNVADELAPHCWRDKWPVLCSLFGLKGVKLPEDNPIEVRRYIKENYKRWKEMEKKYGLQSGHADNERVFPGFEYFLITQFDTDRWYDMSRLYKEAGFTEERSAKQAWGPVFDRMRAAKLIPAEFE
ncbi:unnamed protein product [Clonostachys byssicola]|uniref:PRISE-like Rossmann-fold domain-containing protein n=1 Tax=Clonostachys byssicola TaxID=160290 RepID=A0A9N9UDU4_9HYPO|nr:unnamed protein product [Clonostachys byssicola]